MSSGPSPASPLTLNHTLDADALVLVPFLLSTRIIDATHPHPHRALRSKM
jgi:hypothetical protein